MILAEAEGTNPKYFLSKYCTIGHPQIMRTLEVWVVLSSPIHWFSEHSISTAKNCEPLFTSLMLPDNIDYVVFQISYEVESL